MRRVLKRYKSLCKNRKSDDLVTTKITQSSYEIHYRYKYNELTETNRFICF